MATVRGTAGAGGGAATVAGGGAVALARGRARGPREGFARRFTAGGREGLRLGVGMVRRYTARAVASTVAAMVNRERYPRSSAGRPSRCTVAVMAPRKPKESAANDGGEELTHPLFPNTPTASIALLKVLRLVVERRKGHPGHGLAEPPRVNLTPKGVPPSVIVGDETLAKDYGPGVYEVHAVGPRGRFVEGAGAPYRTKIPDESGHVPMYVDEFEPEAEDAAAAEYTGGETVAELRAENRVLKTMLEGVRRDAESRDAFWQKVIEQQGKVYAANTAGATAMIDRVIQFQSAAAAPAQSQSDPYVKAQLDRADRLEKELASLRGELTTAKIKVAAKSSDGDEEGWGKFAFMALGEAKDLLKERAEAEKKRLELEERKLQLREKSGVVIDGEALPPVETVAAMVAKKKYPKGEGAQVFLRLHRAGMLPPAYVNALGGWLERHVPDDGASGEAPGAPGGSGEPGGAVAG